MSRIVGIYLGTTNSLIAVMEGGEPVVIPSSEGNELVPSIVGFSKTGERLVGDIAKRQAISNPERTIASIKRHMGTNYTVKIDDKEYTPQEISAMILHKMKMDAEAYLGEPVEKAVITVPAYFNDSERQATKDAGTIAGLDVVRIINEPTASSLAYGLDKLYETETILVYDLGGGTFDVSILEIGGGVFEVIATCGDMRLGGDDWDQRIMDYLVEEFTKQYTIDLRTDRVAMQRLKEAAEEAKKELSEESSTVINLPFIAADAAGPKHLEVNITKEKFEQLSLDLIQRTYEPAKKAMADAGLSPMDLDKILLVGGSTRMPMVHAAVRKFFNKEPSIEVDPDKVVAMGAAIQGGVLTGQTKDMVLLDVTPLSLGIETVGGMFTRLIPRNSQIPCSKSRMFTTAADGQTTVEVHVLQGERDIATHNKSLGKFELANIPPAPRGVPQIEVTFSIDANGIVNVVAQDMATGNKQKVTIQSPTNLNSEEIDRMVKEAAVYAEEDAARRKEAAVRNKANTELATAEKTLRDIGHKFKPEDVSKVRRIIDNLKDALITYDYDKIADMTTELTNEMYSLSSDMYFKLEGTPVSREGAAPTSTPTKTSTAGDAGPKVTKKTSQDEADEILSWFKKKK
ncbi:MAG: molecular chaperone DnaK [Candidatus Eremiobacterota bacterium]